MTRLDIERTELREFSAGVQAAAARDLELLRDIEKTLAWLERMAAKLHADTVFAERVNSELGNIQGVIDPDDSVQDSLEKAQSAVNELYTLLISKRQSGRDDMRLTDEDGIEEAFTVAIAQAADLHNAINTLRWNIGEHDADREHRVGRVFTDIDSMFSDMGLWHVVGEGGLIIEGLDRKPSFERTLRKFPEHHKTIKEALGALCANPRPAWIKFEKLSGYRNPSVYSIHVTRNNSHKISFELDGNIAVLRKVGTHKEIDRNP